jgi:hypothetical protein
MFSLYIIVESAIFSSAGGGTTCGSASSLMRNTLQRDAIGISPFPKLVLTKATNYGARAGILFTMSSPLVHKRNTN